MITFTISKEDFRGMIHGSRYVTVPFNERNYFKHFHVSKYAQLQDESEPARSRIVEIISYPLIPECKKIGIKFKMLYE